MAAIARLPHSAHGSFLGFFAPSRLTGKDSNGSRAAFKRSNIASIRLVLQLRPI